MTHPVIDRDPSAAKRRFAVLWVALFVALAVGAVVFALAYSKQEAADRELAPVDAAAHLDIYLVEIDAAEWRAIAVQDATAVRELRAALDRLQAAVRDSEFARLANDSEVSAAYASYVDAVEREIRLMVEGRSREARAFGRTNIDPAHDALQEALETFAARQKRVARRAEASADRLSWVATAFAALTLFLLVTQLVNQRRMLAREREHLEELQSVDLLKDELIASVSHELRTPLTSIRGYLELVLGGEAGELTTEQREFLGIVNRNSDRLLHLVSDLLDVAHIESGRLALDVTDEELTQFVAECVESARPTASDRGIKLRLHRSADAQVRIDRTRVAQVIDNLLSNALKFTDAGGRVDVSLSASNGSAVVEVADTGMGIPVEEQEKLFQRFSRTAAAGEKAIPGTGLGLWISKAIVEAHGGGIAVESVAGRGTTFRVELPRAEGYE